MPHFQLVIDAEPCWSPLENLAGICLRREGLPDIAVEEFMYAGRLACHGRPHVHLYKHRHTRRYLCLDGHGHAYDPRRAGGGWPVLYFEVTLLPDLPTALALVQACPDPGRPGPLVPADLDWPARLGERD